MSQQLASTAHQQLIIALGELESAEHRAVSIFADIMRRHLYRDLGHGSIYDYAKRALSFSRSKTAQFVRLAKALKDHPELSKSMNSGELKWTSARTLLPVLDKKNDKAWIERAKNASRRELAEDVRRARRKPTTDPTQGAFAPSPPDAGASVEATRTELSAGPVTISFQLDAEQLARYEALIEAIRKRGVREDRAELLLAALDALRSPDSSVGSARGAAAGAAPGAAPGRSATAQAHAPYRIVTYVCKTCGTAHTPTHRGDRGVTIAELARQMSDGEFVEEGKRRRHSISPARRTKVIARDGHRCQTKGCGCTRFLEVHHRVPRSRGGANGEENLVTLCHRCHKAAHERELLERTPVADVYPGTHDTGGDDSAELTCAGRCAGPPGK